MFIFWDDSKTDDENDKVSKKARHNKDILQFLTAGVALVTGVVTCAIASKKLFDEMT